MNQALRLLPTHHQVLAKDLAPALEILPSVLSEIENGAKDATLGAARPR